MNNESVKLNLKRARFRSNLTQVDMAEKLGMTRGNYNCIENGNIRLISDHIDKIIQVLGITAEELLLGYTVPDVEKAKFFEEEQQQYKDRINSLETTYEKRLAEKDDLIENLKNLNKSQTDIINLLKWKIETLENQILDFKNQVAITED